MIRAIDGRSYGRSRGAAQCRAAQRADPDVGEIHDQRDTEGELRELSELATCGQPRGVALGHRLLRSAGDESTGTNSELDEPTRHLNLQDSGDISSTSADNALSSA